MYVKMSHISPAIVFVLKYVCKTLTLVLCNTSGVVLFPEATLPLRIIQPSFLAAVERALNQANAPSTIGVVGDLIFCFACFGFSKYLVLFYKKKLLI